MCRTYQSKDYTIEAIQWLGDNVEEIKEFVGENYVDITYYYCYDPNQPPFIKVILKAMRGKIQLGLNDYVIKNLNEINGFYALNEEDFNLMYK